jgi:hypothetical protein
VVHLLREPEKVGGVAATYRILRAAGDQLGLRKLPHRLQQPVAPPPPVLLSEHQRCRDELIERRQPRLDVSLDGDRLGGLDRPPAGEDRDAREQPLFLRREQPIAPDQRAMHGLVARDGRAIAVGQDLHLVLQLRGDLAQRSVMAQRRSQLQRQRNAIQLAADLCDCGCVCAVDLVDRRGGARAYAACGIRTCDKQLRRRRGQDLRRLEVIWPRQGEWQDRGGSLARDAQRLAAGRQDTQLPAVEYELLGDLGANVDQVFAVVEDQQQLLLCEVLLQQFHHGAAALLGQVEHAPDRLGHQRGVCERRKLHDPDTVARDSRLPMSDDVNADLGS